MLRAAQGVRLVYVLLNRADKLSFGAQKQALNKLKGLYQSHATVSFQTFSAAKGDGKVELIAKLLHWLAQPPQLDADNESADQSV